MLRSKFYLLFFPSSVNIARDGEHTREKCVMCGRMEKRRRSEASVSGDTQNLEPLERMKALLIPYNSTRRS